MADQDLDDMDLWESFETDEQAALDSKRPKTDGSQWIGKFDRRNSSRDENENSNDDQSAEGQSGDSPA